MSLPLHETNSYLDEQRRWADAPDLSTRQFHYDAEAQTFSAFASDLLPASPSQTFYLVPHVTGQVLSFVLRSVERDAEGDIESFTFRANDFLAVFYND